MCSPQLGHANRSITVPMFRRRRAERLVLLGGLWSWDGCARPAARLGFRQPGVPWGEPSFADLPSSCTAFSERQGTMTLHFFCLDFVFFSPCIALDHFATHKDKSDLYCCRVSAAFTSETSTSFCRLLHQERQEAVSQKGQSKLTSFFSGGNNYTDFMFSVSYFSLICVLQGGSVPVFVERLRHFSQDPYQRE